MPFWDAISYVTGGVTLVAFAVAAILGAYYYRTRSKERMLKLAAKDERAEVIRDMQEFFQVDAAGLSDSQKVKIILEQIKAKSNRYASNVRVAIIVVVIFGLLAALSFFLQPEPDPPPPEVEFQGKLSDLVASLQSVSNWPATTLSPELSNFWVPETTAPTERPLLTKICQSHSCLSCDFGQDETSPIAITAGGALEEYEDENSVQLVRCTP